MWKFQAGQFFVGDTLHVSFKSKKDIWKILTVVGGDAFWNIFWCLPKIGLVPWVWIVIKELNADKKDLWQSVT